MCSPIEAEMSRELDIQPSVVRQWKRRFEAGGTAAVATNEDVAPVSALREAHYRIRELERDVQDPSEDHPDIDERIARGSGERYSRPSNPSVGLIRIPSLNLGTLLFPTDATRILVRVAPPHASPGPRRSINSS